MPPPPAKFTLWLLNRVVAWEQDPAFRGELARALGHRGAQVRLGQRVVSPAAATAHHTQVACNHRVDSRPGELMHEGPSPAGEPRFDEYFVPIALKCLGLPDLVDGAAALPAFWAERVTSEVGRERLLALFDHTVNRSFDPAFRAQYWADRAKATPLRAVPQTDFDELMRLLADSPEDPTPTQDMFSDVWLNLQATYEVGGYYRVLTEAQAAHGDNVLVGYSQGGLVAAFLGWVDEHIVDPAYRCVRGVVAVQAPLRGSTMATPACADNVLASLLKALRAIPAHNLIRDRFAPEAVNDILDPLLAAPELTVADVNNALSAAWAATPPTATDVRDVLRTARKWLSGLIGPTPGAAPLAFAEIDTYCLDQPGTVLHSLAGAEARAVLTGAVVGTSTRIEAFATQLLRAHKRWARWLPRRLIEAAFRALLGRAEEIWRAEAMDLAETGGAMLPQPVAELRGQWARAEVDPAWQIQPPRALQRRAGDFVIPAVSQVAVHARGPGFFGNDLNADASHISGAELADAPPNNLTLVNQLLRLMGA